MRAFSFKVLLAGLASGVAIGAVAYLGWNPQRPETPERTVESVSRQQPRSVRKRPVSRPVPIEDANELIVVSETPIAWAHSPQSLWSGSTQQQGQGTNRVLYFGTTKEEAQRDPRLQLGKAQAMPARPASDDAIRNALECLLASQHETGVFGEAGADSGLAISVTCLALIALRGGADRLTRRPDAAIKKAETWLASQVDQEGKVGPIDGKYSMLNQALGAWALNGLRSSSSILQRLQQDQDASGLWNASRADWGTDFFVTFLALNAFGANPKDSKLQTSFGSLTNLLMSRNQTATAALWDTPADPEISAELRLVLLGLAADSNWISGAEYAGTLDTLAAWQPDWTKEKGNLLAWWLRAMRLKSLPEKKRAAFAAGLSTALRKAQAKGAWEAVHPSLTVPGRVAATALGALTLIAVDPFVPAQQPVVAKKELDSAEDKDAVPDTAEPSVATAKPSGPGWLARAEDKYPLPLSHTAVRAEISCIVASASVTQTFVNEGSTAIEAVYCFPLPHTAAVTDFQIRIGARLIRGVIRPRVEAEEIYTKAVGEGKVAALLVRETGGVFNHYIGNIEPGAKIDVELGFFERVRFADGRFEWAFPLVVGPYYTGGAPLPAADTGSRVRGHGVEPDTDRSPNASRITPPTLPPDVRSGHGISLEVQLDAGAVIKDVQSPSHQVDVELVSESTCAIKLRAEDSVPNRDFVLSWRIDFPPGSSVTLAHRSDPLQSGWFCTLVNPPAGVPVPAGAAREITFIMDVSGSMTGVPIDVSRRVVCQALERLSPSDTFNVFFFSGGTGSVFGQPEPANPQNVTAATSRVNSLKAGGGTEMLAGLKAAMGKPTGGSGRRLFVFLTDGYVTETPAIISFVRENADEAEFLAFGIGRAVNRELIDGVAAAGNGRAVYCLPRDEEAIGGAAVAFHNFLDTAPVGDVVIDWGKAPVTDVLPAKTGLLQFGDSFAVIGRYSEPGSFAAALSSAGANIAAIALELPNAEQGHAGLRNLWSQAKVVELEQALGQQPDRKAAVASLAKFAAGERLATLWTAFVAVDEHRRVSGGNPRTVVQPVELPQDVNREGVGR